jgi:hypothetical protein
MIGLSKIWRSAGGNTLRSKANNLVDDLAKLALERRMTIVAVLQVILNNLYKRYEEGMHYGKIGDFVPHKLPGFKKGSGRTRLYICASSSPRR